MPIYEYKCSKCAYTLEELTPTYGEHKIMCPECEKKGKKIFMKKIPSLVGGRYRFMDAQEDK